MDQIAIIGWYESSPAECWADQGGTVISRLPLTRVDPADPRSSPDAIEFIADDKYSTKHWLYIYGRLYRRGSDCEVTRGERKWKAIDFKVPRYIKILEVKRGDRYYRRVHYIPPLIMEAIRNIWG